MNAILHTLAIACSADPAAADAAWLARPNVTNAINRGRAHWLAGNVPEAMRAFREGEKLAPWNVEIRADLDAARDVLGTTAPVPSFADRIGPVDVWTVAILSSLAVGAGGVGWLLARQKWCLILAILGIAGWLLLSVVTVSALNRNEPFAIVSIDRVPLRTGNAISYDVQLPEPLPVGTEVSVLGRRGGWVRVRTPGGQTGWLPDSAVLLGGMP